MWLKLVLDNYGRCCAVGSSCVEGHVADYISVTEIVKMRKIYFIILANANIMKLFSDQNIHWIFLVREALFLTAVDAFR